MEGQDDSLTTVRRAASTDATELHIDGNIIPIAWGTQTATRFEQVDLVDRTKVIPVSIPNTEVQRGSGR